MSAVKNYLAEIASKVQKELPISDCDAIEAVLSCCEYAGSFAPSRADIVTFFVGRNLCTKTQANRLADSWASAEKNL